MSPPLLVDTLEVGMTQEPRVAGKSGVARRPSDALPHDSMLRKGVRRDVMIRFSRDTGGHSDSKIPDRLYFSG